MFSDEIFSGKLYYTLFFTIQRWRDLGGKGARTLWLIHNLIHYVVLHSPRR